MIKKITKKNSNLLPKIIRSKYPSDKVPSDFEILDFGAGREALYTQKFVRAGYSCSAYEIEDNFNPEVHFDEESLGNKTFNIVMVSFVIHIYLTTSSLRKMIKKIHRWTDKEGFAIINLPFFEKQFKDISKKNIMKLLLEKFKSVMVERHGDQKVFFCYKYGADECQYTD